MYDFHYYNPVRIYFGKDQVNQLKEAVAPYGPRILLVYGGGSIKRTGLYDRVLSQLREAGKTVFELPGVMPNPRTEKVYEGIELCRRENIDFLLAVGGGSVIDCCKAIAVGAKTDRDFWQTFFINGEPAADAIPLGTILTIPATGSEMDMSAVITNWATSEKNNYDSPLIYPRFSILDPTLTFTLPKNQMANGIVDTMSQVGSQSASVGAAIQNLLWLAALIAVNLAVMNLLPLPALDGGRVFFLLLNGVLFALFKKKIDAKYEGYVHLAGLAALMTLMLMVTFSDIGKIIAR